MANSTNATKVGNLINSANPLPDASVITTASIATIAAAGTTQATATPVAAQLNVINNNTAANGVILPIGVKGQEIILFPQLATNAPKVYPPLGGTINGTPGPNAVNANVTATAQVKTAYYCIDDTGLNWV